MYKLSVSLNKYSVRNNCNVYTFMVLYKLLKNNSFMQNSYFSILTVTQIATDLYVLTNTLIHWNWLHHF